MCIDVDHIRAAVGRSPTRTVFEFCDAAIAGDCQGAMSALDDLLRTERHPLSILNTLATQLRRLMSARCELDRGSTSEEAARAISRPPEGQLGGAESGQQATELNQRDIAGMISRIARADLDFKTGQCLTDCSWRYSSQRSADSKNSSNACYWSCKRRHRRSRMSRDTLLLAKPARLQRLRLIESPSWPDLISGVPPCSDGLHPSWRRGRSRCTRD